MMRARQEPIYSGKELLDIACDKAWRYQFLTYPNPAVGALITDGSGSVISCEAHQEAGKSHAELLACKNAFEKLTNTFINTEDPFEISNYLSKNHDGLFKNLDIIVTLEPCSHEGKTPSCAKLLKNLEFRNVVIGQYDQNEIAKNGAKLLQNQNIKFEDHQNSLDLLYPFLKWNQDRFVFFKIALNANDTFDTGIVSNAKSRTLVHKIRQKIDLLCIGGQSVRIDRPTLDTRLCEKNIAPDVLIYSKRDDFDPTIPLFKVSNRKVSITNEIKIPQDKKFVMIEGGATLFEKAKELCDWLVVFRSAAVKEGRRFDIPKTAQILHQRKIDDDTLEIYRLS